MATTVIDSTSDAEVLRTRDRLERRIAGMTICDLWHRNATEHAEEPAAHFRVGEEWRSLTWGELQARAAEVSMGLRELGVERRDVVAIMASNRWEHLVADMGIVQAGAVPTTLYGTLAPAQIAYVAGDCRARVAIVEDAATHARWQEVRGELDDLDHVVLLEGLDEVDDPSAISFDELRARGRAALAAAPGAVETRWREVRPEDTLVIVYTSGTTGPPKGTVVTHHGMLYAIVANDEVNPLQRGLVGISYLPLAHILERFLSMYNAAWIRAQGYLCPDPSQVLDHLLEARPQAFVGVPRVWEKLKAGIEAKLDAEEDQRRADLARHALKIGRAVYRLEQRGQQPSWLLRAEHALLDRLVLSRIREGIGMDRCEMVFSGAAPLPPEVAEFFGALGLPLHNNWGMTETSTIATIQPPGANRLGTVGRPLPGVEIAIAEDGEVLVRGPITTPGYLNRPEATDELLDDEGWLHTGDVGELEDGYLRLIDRKKELIITSGGKNLSPANIEALVRTHPLIGQALAYGEDRPYVVALVVLDAEVAPAWAVRHDLGTDDLTELATHPRVREEVQRAVDAANQQLARPEQVKRFTILPTEWTPESGELTPTMKLKRRVVHDRHADEITALYED